MKLFLFRFSLTENEQDELPFEGRSAPLSREDFLRDLLSKNFTFDYRKGISIKYHFLEEVDGIIYSAICRYISEEAETDMDDPFSLSPTGRWKKATFLLNMRDDEQVIGLEHASGVGTPGSVIAGLTETLNAIKRGYPYRISVSPLPKKGSFQKAVSEHPGPITSITFDLVTPNPPKVEDATRKALRELREETGASRKKETIESEDGLKTDSEYIRERAGYSEAGGGSAIVKSGKDEVYDSRKKTRTMEAPNELKPETMESKADMIQRIRSLLRK